MGTGDPMTVESLLEQVASYASGEGLEVVERAFEFSRQAHLGQHRASGEEYIQHPLSVAMILAELEMDVDTIAAALLHDVVEDTQVGIEHIREEFGPEVALLVDGVTKLSKLEFRTPLEEQAENFRKMFLAMAEDLRVIIIKLADRLHNMRTIDHLDEERRKRIAQETLEIYAPLAHRLGMWRFKWELEDLAFKVLMPREYYALAEGIARQRAEREKLIQEVTAALRAKLAELGVKGDVQGRAKHFYSIYKKMQEQQKELKDIYDLIAVRVIVNSVRDCYAVLGVVHTMWKPIPGRFKDYIAMPKSNMYQSLHTTVIGPDGEPFEIQIRTWEMHRTAEYGIAAHWRYKEGKKGDPQLDEKLAWLRQVLDWQRELKDAREFMESLKIDLFDDEVFVFTPKGDVIDLPAGATPLDFAYQIHTDVGHRCVGVKVNGKLVPLDYELKNGDIVEILTSKQSAGPSLDWLNLVKTSAAKNKIRQFFKRQRREENIARGKELLEKEAKRLGLDLRVLSDESVLDEVRKKLNLSTPDDVFAAVGYGGITPQLVVSKLKEELLKRTPVLDLKRVVPEETRRVRPKAGQGVSVKGLSNVLVKFAKCCNPVPGDPIIGYITRGRGVSIHRVNCPNVMLYAKEPERLIEASWQAEPQFSLPVDIAVRGFDRPGLLSDVAAVVAELKSNILSARARTTAEGGAIIEMTVEIRDLAHLQQLITKISRVKDVLSVLRVVREKHA
ncbi:MAG: RelA/SpoT family protein [Bacillota bacterium]